MNTAVTPLATESLHTAVGDLGGESKGRWTISSPDPDEFWPAHRRLLDEPELVTEQVAGLREICDRDVVLGFLGRSHLGDTVCTTPLARSLVTERNCRVFSARLRGTYKVFENNPYLAGFRNEERISMTPCAIGSGHIIQRLARTFGFAVDPFPKGQIYLSDEEIAWAWNLRSQLPRNRPIVIVSAGSITDNLIVPSSTLLWQEWIDILSRRFTVIQVAATHLGVVEEVVRVSDVQRRKWRPDTVLDNCFVLENLSVRQFFSVFSIADLFVGTSSGGMHVAAAFEVPCVIALPGSKYRQAPSFPNVGDEGPWAHEAFLYPYHTFMLQHDNVDIAREDSKELEAVGG
jgi:hypothetical protein